MPNAIADGWLVALVAIFVSVLLPLMRLVASTWRKPLDQALARAEKAEAENKTLKEEAVKRTEAWYEEKIEKMLLESKLELCESNLGHWESGRWRPEE